MQDLDRFVQAQEQVWPRALAELRAGRKTSHWMWFIFPQIAGLGHSPMAQHYAVAGLEEAQAYLAHPLLGTRLIEAANALLGHAGNRTADAMLGGIDAVKLRSSLTLFEAAGGDPVLGACLDALYDGTRDPETLRRIGD